MDVLTDFRRKFYKIVQQKCSFSQVRLIISEKNSKLKEIPFYILQKIMCFTFNVRCEFVQNYIRKGIILFCLFQRNI